MGGLTRAHLNSCRLVLYYYDTMLLSLHTAGKGCLNCCRISPFGGTVRLAQAGTPVWVTLLLL